MDLHMSIEDTGTILASIVNAGLDDELNPLDPLYSDKESCIALLHRRPDLHSLVELASGNKNYDPVQRHPSVRRTKAKNEITRFLDKVRPVLMDFLDAGDAFDIWTPDPDLKVDASAVAHIESLQIPAVAAKPSLVIHDLGRFQEDPKLKDRVDGIFQRNTITFLVNASGAGKTRLSFEGLCRHWGFYFIMAQDANHLGAMDIRPDLYETLDCSREFEHQLPPPDSSGFLKALTRNIEITDEKFAPVLLGRLLMFRMYSEIIQSKGITEEHKRRWLLFQLMPQLPGYPSYDILTDVKIYAAALEADEVQDRIAVTFSKLRTIYGAQFHLFHVIDEAQVISREHTSAFQHQGKPYPLLREIIQSWSSKSAPHETSFVILGTDIPKDGFESASFPASVRWCSDTGGFDDEAEHRRYLSPFLTPTYGASPEGQMFLQRAWTWCRGRHRSTDALVKALLLDASRTPHKLLNDYIEKATTHRPTDYNDDEPFRYPINVGVHELSSDFFSDSPLLRSTIQQVLFHYLATARHPSPFSEELTPLVSAGFGRFNDSNMTRIVMDEPMFLIRAARWFCEPPESDDPISGLPPSHNFFTVLGRHREDATSRSLACYLTFYLTRAFDHGAALGEVFSFPNQPDWANQKAELVAFDGKDASVVGYDESSFPTASIASPTILGGVEAWLDDPKGAAFCLTHTRDPDLIFVLKLADGRFLRVILHPVVTEAILRNDPLRKVMTKLDPKNLFPDEQDKDVDPSDHTRVVAKLLDTARPDGPFRLLRVIASFPAKTHLRTLSSKVRSTSANLNTGLFRRATQAIPVSDVLESLIAAVTTGKRKRDSSFPPENHQHKKTRLESETPESPPARTLRSGKGKQKAPKGKRKAP
ncbi:hypothetical protein FB451DRAFT_1086362 [Mycena latifolia]|nr:hypothetical protein FB451DRAFT_1086362 [Mycena latifolia]